MPPCLPVTGVSCLGDGCRGGATASHETRQSCTACSVHGANDAQELVDALQPVEAWLWCVAVRPDIHARRLCVLLCVLFVVGVLMARVLICVAVEYVTRCRWCGSGTNVPRPLSGTSCRGASGVADTHDVELHRARVGGHAMTTRCNVTPAPCANAQVAQAKKAKKLAHQRVKYMRNVMTGRLFKTQLRCVAWMECVGATLVASCQRFSVGFLLV